MEEDAETDPHAQKVADNAIRAVPITQTSFSSIPHKSDPKGSIQESLIRQRVDFYNSYTEQFKAIANKQELPDAVNISEASSELITLADLVYHPSFYFSYATDVEKQALFENPKDRYSPFKIQQLEAYIDQSYRKGKDRIDASKIKLEKEVEHLKEKGTAVVVAVGNDEDSLKYLRIKYIGIELDKNEGENFLASVKGVIPVGASTRDGRFTDYSSRGEHILFSTIVPNADLGQEGTSLTAPAVGALLAKIMKDKHMTVDEAVAYLKQEGVEMKDKKESIVVAYLKGQGMEIKEDTYTYLPTELFEQANASPPLQI